METLLTPETVEDSHDHLAQILTVVSAAQDFVNLVEECKHPKGNSAHVIQDGIGFSTEAVSAYHNLKNLIHHKN